MKTFRRIGVITLFLIAVVAAVFQFRAQIIKILSYSACDTPISYKLGTLDPKFGLSQAGIQNSIQSSADIWSKTYGRPLFIYSPTASLTINFVYDQRSALITDIDRLQGQLDQKGATLQQQISSYESDLSVFQKKLADFNARVDRINKSGGAGPDLYKKLINQQNEIISEGNSLNSRAQQLNLATNDFNSNVQNLNQNVDQFNQSLAQKPEEGLFDGNTNTITIYFADNDRDLIHTLAHEFGHALGMLHTDDPKSIMYTYTTSNTAVTPQDKQQLDYVCREQLLPQLWLQKIAKQIEIKRNDT